MYASQSLNDFAELPAADGPKPELPSGAAIDSIDSIDHHYGIEDAAAVTVGDGIGGDDGAICDFDSIEVENSSNAAVYAHPPVLRGADSSDQLTLSFRGQVYVFDNVTANKMQNVFLLLGGCEQGGELGYQNQRDFDYPVRCSDPHRAASLDRFRQKRKERCFEKKIRYNVRQEVAMRMNRKKGQFTSSKNSDESGSWNTGEAEDSGQDDSPTETLCAHCGTNSKYTPMMRRGPDGPRTLCNACGLFWANRGTRRDLSKKLTDNSSTPTQNDVHDEYSHGNFAPGGTNHVPCSSNDRTGLIAEN